MNDFLVLLMIVAFFAMCLPYVALCDRIVGAAKTEVRNVTDGRPEPTDGFETPEESAA